MEIFGSNALFAFISNTLMHFCLYSNFFLLNRKLFFFYISLACTVIVRFSARFAGYKSSPGQQWPSAMLWIPGLGI